MADVTDEPEASLPRPEKLPSPKPGDTLSLTCDYIKAGQKTVNGNIYSEEVLRKAAADLNERAKNRSVFGQLGNPLDGRSRMIEASHLVLPTYEVKDGKFVGSIEIMNTVRGRDLAEMMEGGMKFTLAPRGIGSFSPEGVVGDDYKIISFDLVPEPHPEPHK